MVGAFFLFASGRWTKRREVHGATFFVNVTSKFSFFARRHSMRIAVGLGKTDGQERLERQGISRRDFMKFCTAVAVTMGLGPSIMAAAGEAAEEALEKAIKNPDGYVAVVEGAIPMADGGKFGYVGGHTMYDLCKRVLPGAQAVITMGTCAAYGGVQAAKPNPTGAVGVNEAFAGMGVKAINLPGCPPNPLNFVGTVVAFLQGREIRLDEQGRPLMFFGKTVHELCERLPHFEAGEFAPSFDSEEARKGWCLYDLGCKGPSTYNNCPKVLFNDTNWPVRAGHPCIGCSEPGFWDELTPFYKN